MASADIESVLLERNELLNGGGYHAQVNIEPGFFPLFVVDENGFRKSLVFDKADGMISAKDRSLRYSKAEFLEIAKNNPERLSPNAILRPIIQDFVFPTVCYVGGAAEIAYFAQNSAVYELLGRPVTPVRHRSSMTILAARHWRTIISYGMSAAEIFNGIEHVRERLAVKYADGEVLREIDQSSGLLSERIEKIASAASAGEPGFLADLRKREKKILWHLDTIRSKYIKSEARRNTDITRRLDDLFGFAFPDGILQERRVSFLNFYNIYGESIVDLTYQNVEPDDRKHKFVTC